VPSTEVRAQAQTGGSMVAAQPVTHDERLVSIKAVVEKPAPENAPSNLCIVGRYILQPEVFGIPEHLGYGKGNEIQLTDAFTPLIQSGAPFHGLRFDGRRYDCGEKGGWLEANLAIALKRPDTAETTSQILSRYC